MGWLVLYSPMLVLSGCGRLSVYDLYATERAMKELDNGLVGAEGRKEPRSSRCGCRALSGRSSMSSVNARGSRRLRPGGEHERGGGADHQAALYVAPRARRHRCRPITCGVNAAAVRCVQADQWQRFGVIIAAWSGRRLTPPGLPSRYVVGRCMASLPAASVRCIRECSKPAQWQCGVGLTCYARFFEGHVTHHVMTA